MSHDKNLIVVNILQINSHILPQRIPLEEAIFLWRVDDLATLTLFVYSLKGRRMMEEKFKMQLNTIFSVNKRGFYLTRRESTYEIGEVGAKIWELCDGEHTLQEIALEITKEYDVPYEQALADCTEFIHDIRMKGLLR